MGPTNVALVKLFETEQELRAAQGRLDAASRNVRLQERRVNELNEQLRLAKQSLTLAQAKAAELDLDIKTREDHIEKLRGQQQNARTAKEYQTFLIEINTQKIDKGKVEDEELQAMEKVETLQKEVTALSTTVDAESGKLQAMQAQINDEVTRLKAEVEALRPAREQAAAGLNPKVLDAFERLAERYEGEAMSAIYKPNKRREEWVCGACNMELVTDVYNKLHSRDDLVFCPSCHRILYIPDDLPPEVAINLKKVKTEKTESMENA